MRTGLRFLFAFLVASLLFSPAALAAQDASPVASPVAGEAEHGVLLANTDPSVEPGDPMHLPPEARIVIW